MKRFLLTLAVLAGMTPAGWAYNDHRGHNLDSLERVVAPWTPDAVDRATEEDLIGLNRAYRDLMLGYEVINGEKAVFYARKAIAISRRKGWTEATGDAARHIGQYYYAREQYDSAMVWFQESLACVERMAGGATSPLRPEGYSETDVDDSRSSLYGAIGNLYNMMDSIPKAMEYYRLAGEIFDKHGWNESNSVLYYNIGETWLEEKDYRQALPAYEKSLEYARMAEDSLLVANALKGLGGLYLEKGRTWKALRCLQEADRYYSLHDDQEFRFRMENLDFLSKVLQEQKRNMAWWLAASLALVLLLVGIILALRKLHRTRKEQAEAAAVMDEALEELRPAPAGTVPHKATLPKLSDRDRQILTLIAQGKTNPQMASALFLSPETIKWYRKKLLAKFDVPTSAALISKAKDLGLV
ncbi:MAG: LuxR family transcriptional regulator [Bacteroidales bacterium]|nr:LuxR family transcriptional regulator [Bacteroidales bacterium]